MRGLILAAATGIAGVAIALGIGGSLPAHAAQPTVVCGGFVGPTVCAPVGPQPVQGGFAQPGLMTGSGFAPVPFPPPTQPVHGGFCGC